MLGNKAIMASNIKYYMEKKEVNSSDVCKALGFKQNTFSNWINAKIYPRIDKIEMMANYFGVTKADLVEARGHKVLIQLTTDERELIFEYRRAREEDKNAIKRLLAYASVINGKEAPHENN